MAFLLPHMRDRSRIFSLEIDNEADEDEGETQAGNEFDNNDEGQDGAKDISAETVTVPHKQNTEMKKILPRKKLPTESASSRLMQYILS